MWRFGVSIRPTTKSSAEPMLDSQVPKALDEYSHQSSCTHSEAGNYPSIDGLKIVHVAKCSDLTTC